MEVPFFRPFPITEEERNSINTVLDSGWYILGQNVKAFEAEFAKFCGVSHCISVGNGTDALEIALRAIGVEAEDNVITVANAGFYSSTALRLIGANPLYADIDSESFTLSTKSVEKLLTYKPKAIIFTHLYGNLGNIDEIVKIAKKHNICLLEDCAQAHGAQKDNLRAGSFGDIACFSFYPTKNLGAVGDGGAIVTNTSNISDKVHSLRQYGWSEKYKVSSSFGKNSRLDEIQAAVLRIKLRDLDAQNQRRRDIAMKYNAAFSSLPIICPKINDKSHVYHLFVLQVQEREKFRLFLKSQGISTDIHYPIADSKQPAYDITNRKVELLVTESITKLVVSLPCFPAMQDKELDHVIEVVTNFFYET